MKKNLFFLVGFALTAYAVYVYDLVEFFSKPEGFSFVMVDGFFGDFLRCVILLALTILFIVKPSPRVVDVPSRRPIWSWFLGFGSALLSLVALVLYVNPHARLSRDVFPPLTFDARTIKSESFTRLPNPPEVVILGSSRAFTLSPTYIRQQIGFETFNMAVEGGRAGDFAVQLNFMQKSGALPRVLIVDVNQTTVDGDFQNIDYQPLALASYMPVAMQLAIAENILQDIISLQSLSDSAYILFVTGGKGRPRTWLFQEDGLGIRKDLPHGQYVELLKITTQRNKIFYQCKLLDPPAKEAFESLLNFAEAKNIGVVLYQSPIHDEFYRNARAENPTAFDTCLGVADEYFRSLPAAYTNVSYTDLLTYKQVALMGEDGFYDAVHLKPNASQLVVDALTPEIQKAMQWAINEGR